MNKTKSLSLYEWLYTPKVYALLDPWQCGWGDGGCAMLAEALSRCAIKNFVEAETFAFVRVSDGRVDHVLCRIGEAFLDQDGADMINRKLRQWRAQELVSYEVVVRPISVVELLQDVEIPFDDKTFLELADLLDKDKSKIEELAQLLGAP